MEGALRCRFCGRAEALPFHRECEKPHPFRGELHKPKAPIGDTSCARGELHSQVDARSTPGRAPAAEGGSPSKLPSCVRAGRVNKLPHSTCKLDAL